MDSALTQAGKGHLFRADPMKFDWKALGLAPLAAPLLFSLAELPDLSSQHRVFGFLFVFVVGCFVSYGTTVFLFGPALFLLSRFARLRFYNVCLLGTLLGCFIFFPVTWMMYRSSGPDSGPPVGTYLEFIGRGWADVTTWCFPLGGLVTALTYCLLATWLFRANFAPPKLPVAKASAS